jgi:hypothetical protein
MCSQNITQKLKFNEKENRVKKGLSEPSVFHQIPTRQYSPKHLKSPLPNEALERAGSESWKVRRPCRSSATARGAVVDVSSILIVEEKV